MKLYSIDYQPYLKIRFFATLIDYTIFTTLFFSYAICFGVQTSPGTWQLDSLPMLPVLLFWMLYFVGLEAWNQATPGHDIFKLKVKKADGNKIGFGDAFKRRICDMLDIGIYGVPAIICILKTDKHQRIGDLFTGTVVVKQTDITVIDFSIK